MKTFYVLTILVFSTFLAACGRSPANTNTARRTENAPTPLPTVFVPKNGDYRGVGKITKIDDRLGSVEFDHEEIPGLMPAMRMEFFVTDKAMLRGLKVGDEANFTVRYNDGQENIIALSKAK